VTDADGAWRLSPAYDMTDAHDPAGRRTNRHQRTLAAEQRLLRPR